MLRYRLFYRTNKCYEFNFMFHEFSNKKTLDEVCKRLEEQEMVDEYFTIDTKENKLLTKYVKKDSDFDD